MAKFSDTERQLLQNVKDDRLQTSLATIRQAVEDIWASDAPRIIKDYTDHGLLHYERIAGYAARLLEANDGRPLSTQESYILLAGIYLHDVGMQCDVLKFPEIKNRAVELGARFNVSFTAKTANAYRLDEQKEIRKNHQYLSAAWIDCASQTGTTVLGVAAKSIPQTLIDDLMDICKHHTKLPITDCPIPFKFDPSERKQLVAAILRFADELDIDSRRVSLETVKTFSLDPSNSVYWWLHNRTSIVFTARNVILITIRLNSVDLDHSGSYIHAAFITEFQSKNRPVVTVLAQNGIPIVISAESKVVSNDREEALPPEMADVLRKLQQKQDPLRDLAEELRVWLRAIRYETSEISRQGSRVADMIATLDLGTVKQRVLVRCIGGEIGPSDVEQVDKLLDRKTPQAWLISDKRVSPGTREKTAGDDALQVFTLSEFLKQKVWGPYFDFLTALVTKDRIPELYVDVGCYKQEIRGKENEVVKDKHNSLETYIDRWLKERGKMHVSLLGSFGTGKTWFCRHYAYEQLQKYLSDPANERLPLLITLRAFAKAMTAEQLINDALLEQYKLQFLGSAFEVFQEMNRRGKLLLILDGFDEMARQVDYQTVVDNFWELARLVDENSKVILTSRTEYFRWAEESEKILAGEEFGRKILVLEPPKFEVMHLEEFSDDQIREVISRRHGGEKSGIADRILKNKNLAEMARRPILIELLLAALQEVNADILENSGQVYLYATNKLLLRNIDTRRTFTTTADKLYFLCELAWEMIKTDNLRIHYGSIPERIKAYFGGRIKDQHELDTWDFDLRNQTLLHRDAAGYYEFAHKSLAEYFVAFKFAAELGCLDPTFAQAYREADGKPCSLAIEPKNIAALAQTFGLHVLSSPRMAAVATFLQQMLDSEHIPRLWHLLDQTKNAETEAYVGGNLATLLSMLGATFQGRSLKGVVLHAARLPHDLRDINLENADLALTNLSHADLRGANLRNCVLSPGCLVGADLRDVNGIDKRFIKLVQRPPDELWASQFAAGKIWSKNTLKSIHHANKTQLSIINAILDKDCSGIVLVAGSAASGKTTLLALLEKEASKASIKREMFWHAKLNMHMSYKYGLISHVTRWLTLHRSQTMGWYRALATFLTVCGYDELYSYLAAHQFFEQRPRTSKAEHDRVLEKAFSIMLSIFKKENLIICLDDIDHEDRELMAYLKYFASKKIATTIIAVFHKVPPDLLKLGLTEYRLGPAV
jgi:hypothetical protein